MNPFIDEIVNLLAEASGLPAERVADLLAVPPDDSLGDYALPCFTLAKERKQNPAQIAGEIADAAQHVVSSSTRLQAIQATGPYVNVRVDSAAFIGWVLSTMRDAGDNYGSRAQGEGKTVTVDFSAPNSAKPFSIAHLRSTAIGHAICNLHSFAGWRCVRINYPGDYGANFGQLLAAYAMWGDEAKIKANPVPELQSLYVRFNEELQSDPSLQQKARDCVQRLAAGDEELQRLWRWFTDESLAEAQRIYDILGVHFDETLGESHFADDLDDVIGFFQEARLAEESDGALIVHVAEPDEEMAPLMLRNSHGTSTYHSRDVAALLHRWQTHAFDKMVYVTDKRQALHFTQLFRALRKTGAEWVDRCVHAEFGLMSFKGKAFSTRKGFSVLLEDVLQQAIDLTRTIIAEKNPDLADADQVARQVGISAVVYADVSNRRTRDISFSLEEVLNFDGETGPYLQYTHARYCSILRRYAAPVDAEADPGVLTEPAEMRVARVLCDFPKTLDRAVDENEPSFVASYLIDLATQANRLYNEVPVLNVEEDAVKAARIRLIDAVRQVLSTGMRLLGMSTPEEM